MSGSGADYTISTLNKIRRALEGAGVESIDDDAVHGPGVRVQKGKPPARESEGAMPLMVGNIVVLNSGSPPMTVKAITHAGQVLCQWIDAGGVLHEMEFAPEMLSDEPQAPRQNKRGIPEEPD